MKQIPIDEFVHKFNIERKKFDSEYIYKLLRDENIAISAVNQEMIVKLLIKNQNEKSNKNNFLRKKRTQSKLIPKKKITPKVIFLSI